MIEECQKAGLPEPKYKITTDEVKLIVPQKMTTKVMSCGIIEKGQQMMLAVLSLYAITQEKFFLRKTAICHSSVF